MGSGTMAYRVAIGNVIEQSTTSRRLQGARSRPRTRQTQTFTLVADVVG